MFAWVIFLKFSMSALLRFIQGYLATLFTRSPGQTRQGGLIQPAWQYRSSSQQSGELLHLDSAAAKILAVLVVSFLRSLADPIEARGCFTKTVVAVPSYLQVVTKHIFLSNTNCDETPLLMKHN